MARGKEKWQNLERCPGKEWGKRNDALQASGESGDSVALSPQRKVSPVWVLSSWCLSQAPSEVRFSFLLGLVLILGILGMTFLLLGHLPHSSSRAGGQGGAGAQGLAAPCPPRLHFPESSRFLLNLTCKGRELLNEVADPGYCTTPLFVPLLAPSVCGG